MKSRGNDPREARDDLQGSKLHGRELQPPLCRVRPQARRTVLFHASASIGWHQQLFVMDPCRGFQHTPHSDGGISEKRMN